MAETTPSMKCVCGHEFTYNEEMENDEPLRTLDLEIAQKNYHRTKFIPINGVRFFAKTPNTSWRDDDSEVKLFACPKCSTVRMYDD